MLIVTILFSGAQAKYDFKNLIVLQSESPMQKIRGWTGRIFGYVDISQKMLTPITEFYQELEPGSFSMTNKTELSDNFQVLIVQ